MISFSCFGFVAVVPGNPETQTVSLSLPKLCAALQRKFGTDAAYRESLIPVPETRSAFHPHA
jgi:hypothetical protein